MIAPVLVTVAHGTRRPTGNEVARVITQRAGELLGWPALPSYVELCEPSFDRVLSQVDRPVVAVPLLLTTGHHMRVDLPRSVAGAGAHVALAGPLGPHDLLARATVDRLREAGARADQPVVLVAAGSRDPSAWPQLRRARRALSVRWRGEVRLATLAGHGPRPAEVLRRGDAVAPYLLAPGHFLDRAVDEAQAAAAGVVAEPLGAHPAVVRLVAHRALTTYRRRRGVVSSPAVQGLHLVWQGQSWPSACLATSSVRPG